VALKVQDVDHECPTNRYERFLYPLLQGGIGMPTLWASGIYRNLDYLAIDLLGPSLDNLYRKAGLERMDLRSVLCIGIQVVRVLESGPLYLVGTDYRMGFLCRSIDWSLCILVGCFIGISN
jgi:casein kinase 1